MPLKTDTRNAPSTTLLHHYVLSTKKIQDLEYSRCCQVEEPLRLNNEIITPGYQTKITVKGRLQE